MYRKSRSFPVFPSILANQAFHIVVIVMIITIFCVTSILVEKAWTEDAKHEPAPKGITMLATSYQPTEESMHEPAPNGLTIPEGYRNWPAISVTHRVDNNSMRVILGNDVARNAIEKGTTKPWPDNSTFVKISWKAIEHENWNTAFVPGDFIQLEVMKKDSKKYAETGGWGFGRWRGMDLKPYGKDATFVQECFGCHTPVKDRDYVYTKPPLFPR